MCSSEDELCRADLLDVVDPSFEKLERASCNGFRLFQVALLAVDLGQRAEHVARLRLEVCLDEDAEGLTELSYRDVRRLRASG